MTRFTVSILIIGVIIALGIFAVAYISYQNDRLLGQIQELMAKYDSGEDASAEIQAVEQAVEHYAKRMTVIADDEKLDRIREISGELKYHYREKNEEFSALCHRISDLAGDLLRAEIPSVGRIL